MCKKLLSILLTVIMIFTLVPSLAFAENTAEPSPDGTETERTINLSIDGKLTWNKVGEEEATSFTVDVYTSTDVGESKNWAKVENLSPAVSLEGEGFAAQIELGQFDKNTFVRASILKGEDLVGESKAVNGTKEEEVVPPNNEVAMPDVKADYYSDVDKKIVNGLRVTITPGVDGNKAETAAVYLYYSDKMIDPSSGAELSDKNLVKQDNVTFAEDKPVIIDYDKNYFFNNSRSSEKYYYVKVVAKKQGDYKDAVVFAEKVHSPYEPAKCSDMTVVRMDDKSYKLQARHKNLAMGCVFKGYAEIETSYKSNAENITIKTEDFYGKVDGEGIACYNIDLADYYFEKDAKVNVKVYIESHIDGRFAITGMHHHYDSLIINDYKPTKAPTKKAMFNATMDEYGDITFDTRYENPATNFDYEVKHNGKTLKTVKNQRYSNGGRLLTSYWMSGITSATIDECDVVITGHAFNSADHVVELKARNKKQLTGSIKINLPTNRQAGYATVDLSNLYPAEARNSLNYAWYLDGKYVSSSQNYYITAADAGKKLSVTVTGTKDFKGTISSPTIVIDDGRPVIEKQPVGFKRYIGEGTQSLYVQATTTGSPLKYQWYKNGAMINGATSSSYVPTSEERGKDEYFCMVYNNEGKVFTNKVFVQNLIRVGVPTLKAEKNRTTIKLMWTKAKNAKEYKVYERKNGKYKSIKTVKGRSLVVKVKPGSKHVYKIKAVNGGCYSYSAAKKFTAKK